MHFREYRESDVEAMSRLDEECFTTPFQFDREMMREFAEAPEAIVILVEDDDTAKLIGFIIVHIEEAADHSYAYVVTIDVVESLRRTGIGGALLDWAEQAARSAGMLQIALHVAVDNLSAIHFYERQHYQRIGLAKRFYREAGLDALVFAKSLDESVS